LRTSRFIGVCYWFSFANYWANDRLRQGLPGTMAQHLVGIGPNRPRIHGAPPRRGVFACAAAVLGVFFTL
jgi:hypothetical protein